MSFLERIRELKEERMYDINDICEIADEMEEVLGEAGMWRALRPGFDIDEFIENLEYIAKVEDI